MYQVMHNYYISKFLAILLRRWIVRKGASKSELLTKLDVTRTICNHKDKHEETLLKLYAMKKHIKFLLALFHRIISHVSN